MYVDRDSRAGLRMAVEATLPDYLRPGYEVPEVETLPESTPNECGRLVAAFTGFAQGKLSRLLPGDYHLHREKGIIRTELLGVSEEACKKLLGQKIGSVSGNIFFSTPFTTKPDYGSVMFPEKIFRSLAASVTRDRKTRVQFLDRENEAGRRPDLNDVFSKDGYHVDMSGTFIRVSKSTYMCTGINEIQTAHVRLASEGLKRQPFRDAPAKTF